MEAAALIQWICVRKAHRSEPSDPSTPFSMHENGWAYCPSGASEAHLWYETGGVTRTALDRFRWPSEREVEGPN